MSTLSRRRAHILELLHEHGAITVAELSARLDVSGMTARRDLEELARAGAVRRTHGGAVLRGGFEAEAPAPRPLLAGASRVATALPAGATVFLDSSAAGYSVAHALQASPRPLTAVTNALAVMQLLAPSPTIRLVGIPGRLSWPARSFVGADADAVAREHFVDTVVLGADVADALDARVKAAMLERAGEAVVLGAASLAACLEPLRARAFACRVRVVPS
jgi:DeoR family transcriptional regulator of aga operon